MRTASSLPLLLALAVVPGCAYAQSPRYPGAASPAAAEGYSRGVRAGQDDARRGQSFDYRDESDYRSADAGYRSQYGSRDWYRDEFRRGFADGYAAGYRGAPGGRYGNDPYGRDPYGREPYGRDPYGRDPYGRDPYGRGQGGYDGRGGPVRGPGGAVIYRNDLAFQAGVSDGYDAGLDDGRDGRRFDPIAEKRYRSGDHGYDRRYGSKDLWKIRYREGFKLGYEQGYQDARRYGRNYDPRRYDPRYDRRPDRPWWWPFVW